MTRQKKRKRTIWLAVAGVRDESFASYDEACAWLDKVSPETATRGFDTEDRGVDDGVRTVIVRHAERDLKFYPIVRTDRATGVETRIEHTDPEYAKTWERIRGHHCWTAEGMRHNMLATLDPKCPPVCTTGATYRFVRG